MLLMVPRKTKVSDIQKLLGYLARQVGWVEPSALEKALGPQDDRKIAAMVEFGLVMREDGNLKATELGLKFNPSDPAEVLREVIRKVDLYRGTLEWAYYGNKSEITTAEIGQYWESSYKDTIGNLKGTALKDGAVCFGRIVEGAGLGFFKVGRGGKESRILVKLDEVGQFVDGNDHDRECEKNSEVQDGDSVSSFDKPSNGSELLEIPESQKADVAVTASPNIHVNVEIHIAADATADTVREIFKNMARYVLNRPTKDNIGQD